MDATERRPAERRPYTRPKLTPINLYGGEVLGIGCKTMFSPESPVVEIGGVEPEGCGLTIPCFEAST